MLHAEPARDFVPPSCREPGFEQAVLLAAALCGTPIAAVTLVDRDRHRAKAAVGITGREARRLEGLSALSSCADGLLVLTDVDDGREDEAPRGAIRFYAAAAIRGRSGQLIGTLCVADRAPRRMDSMARSALEAIAMELGEQLAWA